MQVDDRLALSGRGEEREERLSCVGARVPYSSRYPGQAFRILSLFRNTPEQPGTRPVGACSRHPMPIGRGDKPFTAHPLDPITVAAGPARLPLQIRQRRVDRPLVRGQQRRRDVVTGDREQDADALCRERQIKPRHRRARAHHPQHRPIERMAPTHQRHEPRSAPRDHRSPDRDVAHRHPATDPATPPAPRNSPRRRRRPACRSTPRVRDWSRACRSSAPHDHPAQKAPHRGLFLVARTPRKRVTDSASMELSHGHLFRQLQGIWSAAQTRTFVADADGSADAV
jgi:hypothetical protein